MAFKRFHILPSIMHAGAGRPSIWFSISLPLHSLYTRNSRRPPTYKLDITIFLGTLHAQYARPPRKLEALHATRYVRSKRLQFKWNFILMLTLQRAYIILTHTYTPPAHMSLSPCINSLISSVMRVAPFSHAMHVL